MISAGKLQYLWGPNNVSLTLLKGGIVSPTATVISKDKIFEIQIEIGTIAMELNKIELYEIEINISAFTSTAMLNKIKL